MAAPSPFHQHLELKRSHCVVRQCGIAQRLGTLRLCRLTANWMFGRSVMSNSKCRQNHRGRTFGSMVAPQHLAGAVCSQCQSLWSGGEGNKMTTSTQSGPQRPQTVNGHKFENSHREFSGVKNPIRSEETATQTLRNKAQQGMGMQTVTQFGSNNNKQLLIRLPGNGPMHKPDFQAPKQQCNVVKGETAASEKGRARNGRVKKSLRSDVAATQTYEDDAPEGMVIQMVTQFGSNYNKQFLIRLPGNGPMYGPELQEQTQRRFVDSYRNAMSNEERVANGRTEKRLRSESEAASTTRDDACERMAMQTVTQLGSNYNKQLLIRLPGNGPMHKPELQAQNQRCTVVRAGTALFAFERVWTRVKNGRVKKSTCSELATTETYADDAHERRGRHVVTQFGSKYNNKLFQDYLETAQCTNQKFNRRPKCGTA